MGLRAELTAATAMRASDRAVRVVDRANSSPRDEAAAGERGVRSPACAGRKGCEATESGVDPPALAPGSLPGKPRAPSSASPRAASHASATTAAKMPVSRRTRALRPVAVANTCAAPAGAARPPQSCSCSSVAITQDDALLRCLLRSAFA